MCSAQAGFAPSHKKRTDTDLRNRHQTHQETDRETHTHARTQFTPTHRQAPRQTQGHTGPTMLADQQPPALYTHHSPRRQPPRPPRPDTPYPPPAAPKVPPAPTFPQSPASPPTPKAYPTRPVRIEWHVASESTSPHRHSTPSNEQHAVPQPPLPIANAMNKNKQNAPRPS